MSRAAHAETVSNARARVVDLLCNALGSDSEDYVHTGVVAIDALIAAVRHEAGADRLHPHEDGVSPLPRQAHEVRKLEGNDLVIVMRSIRSLDCGALYCRYCRAGQNNQWQHDEHCAYEQSVKDAEAARAIIAWLRVQMAGADALLLLSDPQSVPPEDEQTDQARSGSQQRNRRP